MVTVVPAPISGLSERRQDAPITSTPASRVTDTGQERYGYVGHISSLLDLLYTVHVRRMVHYLPLCNHGTFKSSDSMRQ